MDVEIATSGREAIERAMRRPFDVALVDLGLPDMGGEEVGARLLEIRRATVVVALTATDDELTIRRVMAAGFRGYLTKDLRISVLSQALRAALAGETVTLPGGRRARPRPAAPDRFIELLSSSLTSREREVLQLLASGKANKDIAETLFISTHTVAVHVARVLEKTGSPNRTAAVAYATRHHLLESTRPGTADQRPPKK